MRRIALTLPLFAIALTGCKKIDELQAELDKTKAALTQTEGELSAQKKANSELEAENTSLKDRIAQLEAEIAQLDQQIEEMAQKMGATKDELKALLAEKAEREKELAVYRNLVAQLKALVDAGTIKLEIRKGNLVVKLANSILFGSGKASLKPEGKEALAKLAVALKSVKNRDWLIAGHTDNVPIRSKNFKNNWELSTARSISVVETLTSEGMDPKRLGAAGFAEFDPVADNSTEEGRALNRRIEIILLPNIGELPGMKEIISGSKS